VHFLKVAFGVHEIGRSTAPDGRIANCQLQFSTTTIMVSERPSSFPRHAQSITFMSLMLIPGNVSDLSAAPAHLEHAGRMH
jgi:uncharacterized glyoxalase superfamily protein PhnB